MTTELKLFFKYLLYGSFIYAGIVILDLITFGTLNILSILQGLLCLISCSGDEWIAWFIVILPYLMFVVIGGIRRWRKLGWIAKFIIELPIIVIIFLFVDHLLP